MGFVIGFGFIFIAFVIFLTMILVYVIRKNIHKNNQLRINNNAISLLKKYEFKETKVFYIPDNMTMYLPNEYKKLLFIDTNNKKIAFINYSNEKVFVCNFSEVLKYNVYANEISRTSSNVSNHSNTSSYGDNYSTNSNGYVSSTTSYFCTNLKLTITFDNMDCPNVIYNLISSETSMNGVNKSSSKYNDLSNSLNELTSFLDVIIKNK